MIKPAFEAINSLTENSFLVRVFEEEAFTSPYHYHPEFELTLITRGSGKRYVGNHMDHFKEGDLVFLGANLPHCWKTDPIHKGEINAGSIVIQFTENFLGADFFNKPELAVISNLLKRSSCGIQFKGAAGAAISEAIKNLAGEEVRFKQLLYLLDILYRLSITSDYTQLNRLNHIYTRNGNDLERLNTVFSYIIDNFKIGILLNEAASRANMTPNAFCKYFKKTTHKTFIEVVVEYRLHYSTIQLIHTNKSVAEICFDCGFNDVAHFSRMFKTKMNISPLQYRKTFVKNL
ncbi:MAG: AraC family transcriptional regulator [Chitinophagaceae bacterium]